MPNHPFSPSLFAATLAAALAGCGGSQAADDFDLSALSWGEVEHAGAELGPVGARAGRTGALRASVLLSVGVSTAVAVGATGAAYGVSEKMLPAVV